MKKILVTGAAGFIGMHLALKLKDEGHNVIGYDNFNSYYSIELKYARRDCLQQKGVEVIKADLCDQTALRHCLDAHAITHVVHLAAQAGQITGDVGFCLF